MYHINIDRKAEKYVILSMGTKIMRPGVHICIDRVDLQVEYKRYDKFESLIYLMHEEVWQPILIVLLLN